MKITLSAALVLWVLFLTSASHPAVASPSAATSTTSIRSSADTYIDSSKPATNFGGAATMSVRSSGPARRGLVRFSLSAIPAGARITSAILRLYVSSDGSTVAGSVKAVNGSWAEKTVTYSRAPAVGGTIATIPNPASPNKNVSVNITSYVVGKTSVNLYLVSSSNDGVIYYAREKGSSLAPQLIVTWSIDPTPTPVVTHTETPTPVPTLPSLTLPLRLAFYYPWFPETWTQGTVYPFTNYTPTLGFYDSSNAAVISQHIADMQYAGIQGGIASWWGQGSQTDRRIPALLAAAEGTRFKWTLYYEREGQGNPDAAAITSHLTYISNQYSQSPSFLRIGGKPVMFVYADGTDNCEMADRWKAANTLGFYVVLKVFPGYEACANQPNSWHQYGPAANYDVQGPYSVSISPGYWKKGESPLLARDITRWNQDIANMVAAHADFQLITTWNEWGEGTVVEPSNEFGRVYLDALHNNGQTGTDPTIMAAGDIICDALTTTSTQCQQMAASQLVVDQRPNAALILGDLCHTPSANCFSNYYNTSWGRVFAISRPTTGNHDYIAPAASYYYDYWNGAGNLLGPAGDRTKGYYSFDVGTWHLIALNSQCSQVGGCNAGDPQYLWLQQDLQNHQNLCTLAYYHIPVFSSGGQASTNMLQVYTLLYNNNVDVVLDGHDHIYERFAPQDPNGLADPVRGIREFIVGTGGANHTGVGTAKPNSQVRNGDTFGALRLTLHINGYDWQFMPIAGKTFTDSGSTMCH